MCDTVDAGVGVYRLSYMYVHICRHTSWSMYVCMGVYTCVMVCELTIGLCMSI